MASDRSAQIIEKAKELGAAMAGIASVEPLQESPSHQILGKYGTKIDGVHSFEGMIEGFNEIRSALVTEGISQTEKRIKWCRRCELACPVGS